MRLDAWVNDSQVVELQPLSFWLAIQNTSREESITEVRVLAFRNPGFTTPPKQSACWDRGRPVCYNTRAPGTRFEPFGLGPREARTIEGVLLAGEASGRYGLSAVVEWRDAGGVLRRKPISVGPVVVQNQLRAAVLIAAQAAQRFLKDLALPIALAVLAYVLKKREADRETENKEREQKREDERKARDRAREEREKEAAERAARIRETWNMMMPKAHQNAERYYMPLCANASLLEDKYATGERDLVFFYLLRFLALMRMLKVEIGGFYLKDRDGEWIVSSVWNLIRERADALFTLKMREQAELDIKPHMLYPEFDRMSWKLDALRRRFMTHYKDVRVQVTLLRLFRLVLEYEMNYVYESWYGAPEKFPREELQNSLPELQGMLSAKEFHDLDARIFEYANSPRIQARELQRMTAGS